MLTYLGRNRQDTTNAAEPILEEITPSPASILSVLCRALRPVQAVKLSRNAKPRTRQFWVIFLGVYTSSGGVYHAMVNYKIPRIELYPAQFLNV